MPKKKTTCKRCKRLEQLIAGTAANFDVDSEDKRLTPEVRTALKWASNQVNEIFEIIEEEFGGDE